MNFKYRVLITAPPIIPNIFNYKDLFDKENIEIVLPPFRVVESLKEAELIELLKNIDAILCGDDELNNNVFKETRKLKVISKWGTGIDSIDKSAAEKNGIKVLRVKDVFSEPVSDSVLAYVLLFCRRIMEKNYLVKNDKWEKVESYALNETSLGIIGLGHIGKVLARKAIALGMKVYGCDLKPDDDFIHQNEIKMLPIKKLLERSDFVSLHCDLNESSYHLISDKELKLMKSSSVIINTCRGEVINQKALEAALLKNEIQGAALDVFEVEPLPKHSKLRSLDNVYLSPHNSNASPKVFKNVDLESISNIFKGLQL